MVKKSPASSRPEGLKSMKSADIKKRTWTEAEKSAINYADLSANDHFSINDATFSGLRRYYSEAEIVELGMFIAFFIGFGRLGATWDMVEELPQSFQDKSSKIAPWRQQSVTVRG